MLKVALANTVCVCCKTRFRAWQTANVRMMQQQKNTHTQLKLFDTHSFWCWYSTRQSDYYDLFFDTQTLNRIRQHTRGSAKAYSIQLMVCMGKKHTKSQIHTRISTQAIVSKFITRKKNSRKIRKRSFSENLRFSSWATKAKKVD